MIRPVGLIACVLMIVVAWNQSLSIASKRDKANSAIVQQLATLDRDIDNRVALPRCGFSFIQQNESQLYRYPDSHGENQQRHRALIEYREHLSASRSVAYIRLTSSVSAFCVCTLALATVGMINGRSTFRRG